MKTPMRRAAIYSRFSTDKQDLQSCADQEAVCERHADAHGWKVVGRYRDAAVSGLTAARRGYQELLAAAAKSFDVIVVAALDRLWRDMAEMQTQMRDLWFRGIEVVAVAQGIASEATEDSDTHFAVHGFVAQLHAKRASQDTHRALDELDRKGYSTGGRCFGYRSVEVTDERNRDGRPRKRLVIDEQQAAIVRRIFAAYGEGYSLPRIAHRLNAEGVAPPLHGTRHGQIRKAWSTSSIHAMLRNRRYFGEHSWDARQYKKDAKSGKRRSRMRATGKWRVE